MEVIRKPDKDERVFCTDIDDTLVMWPENPHDFNLLKKGYIEIENPYTNGTVFLKPHKEHIKIVKHFHSRGYHIIAWSGGGGRWARAVVEALSLNEYIDEIMCKPIKYIDDEDVSEWFGSRIYVGDKS